MTKPLQKRHRSQRRIRALVLFAAVMSAVFCVSIVYQGVKSYRETVREGTRDASRLAHILADHVELTFLGIDLSLRRAVDRQYFNTLFGNNLPQYTEQNFKIWLGETQQIAALALINDAGEVEVAAHKKGYESWLDYHKALAGQQLFDRMRSADDTEVFVGKHLTEDNSALILMSRRYNKLNGEFGGIVIAAMNPQYFIDFYDSIAQGRYKFMSVMLPDGALLASGPLEDPASSQISRQLLAAMETESEESHSAMVKTTDGMRVVSVSRLKNLPIAVSVVVNDDDFMASWWRSQVKDAGFLVFFIMFSSILSYFALKMARQTARAEESESAAILASQAKSEFLANMSHELRTPLNAIIGFSEMINSGYFGPLNAKQKERVHDINLCGSHLLQLITDILEFSKGDAGKLELAEEKVDLADLVNESVRITHGKIRAKGIQLVVSIDPELPCLWGDKRKIRQVLINLLSNSMKFTPENGVITVAARLDSHHNMTLSVTDTGIGIAEDDIPKALSVFGQVNRSKSHEGTGLGLPLCKMYAELHDGKLLLTSKVGEGTTVKIVFPHQRTLLSKRES